MCMNGSSIRRSRALIDREIGFRHEGEKHSLKAEPAWNSLGQHSAGDPVLEGLSRGGIKGPWKGCWGLSESLISFYFGALLLALRGLLGSAGGTETGFPVRILGLAKGSRQIASGEAGGAFASRKRG